MVKSGYGIPHRGLRGWDYFHIAIGIFCGIIILSNLWFVSLLIILVYIVYQLYDYLKGEKLKVTLRDIALEFGSGLVVGVIIASFI